MINLNLNKRDFYCLIAVFIISLLLTVKYIIFNLNLGIQCSDVYLYLVNALYYNGITIPHVENIVLSPTICYLTSLLFKLGLTDTSSIFIVTGAFAIFGNIGCYLLFRQYFDEILSLTGTVIYSTSTLYLIWLANGSLDIPATGLIIWIVFFAVKAIKENPRFYIPLSLFFIVAVFTRYTILLILPVIVFYYILEKGFTINKRDLKYIIAGILIGVTIFLLIQSTITNLSGGDFLPGSQINGGISGSQGKETDPAFNQDIGYYLNNLPNFISNSHTYFSANPVLDNPTPLSWGVILIIICGMGLWIKENKREIFKKDYAALALFIIAVLSFARVSSVVTIVIVLFGLYLLGKDSKHKEVYLMLGWIFSNFIFYSYYDIKVNRYILPIFPALMFFVILSIDTIQKHFKINKNLIAIIILALFLIQGFAFTLTVDETYTFKQTEDMSNYIIENNPDYKNIPIATYNMRPYMWWLGPQISGIAHTETQRIDESNFTYYISSNPLNLTNYTEVKNIGTLYLYKKNV